MAVAVGQGAGAPDGMIGRVLRHADLGVAIGVVLVVVMMVLPLPGKQMAIDDDFNAGQITDGEARARRDKIQREADFYGAMDGASKFVKGDAVAGIVIVSINLLAGMAIGMLQQGKGFGDALST